MIYIHGKGGNAEEAAHYKMFFPDCEVIGLDYTSQTPWEAMNEFSEFFDEISRRYASIILIANSIGAFFAMNAVRKSAIEKLYRRMLLIGVPCNVLQWVTIFLWIVSGLWCPFVVWFLIAIPVSIWLCRNYFRNVKYICPECHEVFKPTFKEMLWAKHTLTTRKLTCTECGHKGFCVEIWGGDEK